MGYLSILKKMEFFVFFFLRDVVIGKDDVVSVLWLRFFKNRNEELGVCVNIFVFISWVVRVWG